MSYKMFSVPISLDDIDPNDDISDVDIDIALSDIFSEIDDDELIDELNNRRLDTEITVLKIKEQIKTAIDIKRLLCDYFQIGYHTENAILIESIVNELNKAK